MTGPHRPALHRVRADARRRGAGLRLRRADAHADDVLAPAEAPGAARLALQPRRARLRRAHARLPRGARARRSTRAGHRARSSARCVAGGSYSSSARACKLGARADRGPRHDHRHRHRARGLDASTITDRYARTVEAIYDEIPEVEALSSSSPASRPSRNGIAFVAPEALGASATRKQQEIVAELLPRDVAGCPGVLRLRRPTRPRSARAPSSKPVRVRDPGLGVLRRAARRMVERDDGGGARTSRAHQPRHRPQAQQAASSRSTSTATRPPISASSVETIGRTLETLLGGRQVTRFKHERQAVRRRSCRSPTSTARNPRRPRDDLRARQRRRR